MEMRHAEINKKCKLHLLVCTNTITDLFFEASKQIIKN